ncbi:MAG: hypothetical protein ACKOUK_06725, partial [Verrucomicrobiota bacterium]
MVLDEQKELGVRLSGGGLGGLVAGIRALQTAYATALTAAVDAKNASSTSRNQLTEPGWVPAQSSLQKFLAASLVTAQNAVANRLSIDATAALAAATSATTLAAAASPEFSLANEVATAGNLARTAIKQLSSGQDALATASATTAATNVSTALAAAQALQATLQNDPTPDTARLDGVAAVISAAEAVLAVATATSAAASTPLAAAAGLTPRTYKLTAASPPTTYLSIWGTSGAVSITDGRGGGIVITPDGRVDPTPAAGAGWQFLTDATFVLPDGTKISYSPGTPATLLATRGDLSIEIGNLAAGQSATENSGQTAGQTLDAARNDGHIFRMGATVSEWTLLGTPVGATPGSREVVGATPLTNEETIDVTASTISPIFAAELEPLGINVYAYDTDQDGALGAAEWPALNTAISKALTGLELQFTTALVDLKKAVAATSQLNVILEEGLEDLDETVTDRRESTATRREELQRIDRELQSIQATRGGNANPFNAPPPAATTASQNLRVLQGFARPVEIPTPVPPSADAPTAA